MAQSRYYSSDALPTTLAAALGATGNPLVAAMPGVWPAGYPYAIVIDWGNPSQEALLVTGAPTGSGPFTLPCTRGIDGSTGGAGGVAHSAGAEVVHGTTSYEPTLLQTALQAGSNLSDLGSAGQARTSLGLGSAAVEPSSAFDAAGTSATETTRAEAAEALLLPLPSGTPAAGQAPVATGAGQASAWMTVTEWLAPSGDTTGAIDQAAITAAEARGFTVNPGPGTFWVTGLTKQAGTLWQCSGRDLTTIMLANGANADVIQGASFGSLTLTGSIAGIAGWGIRDCTIDGNKANQSGTSFGLRVYGTDFDVTNVTIRNCLTDGLYTEWSSFAGFPAGADQSMEAQYKGLKVYNCGGGGWHNRGPHDSAGFDVNLYDNGSGLPCYWGEGKAASTVAAGSNGVAVSTFTGSGTLNVVSTLNFPAASIGAAQGSLTITGLTGGTGSAVITYTAATATTFTGCTTVSGSGTLATGSPVSMTGGGYSATGMLLFGAHTYGAAASWGYLLDTSTHLTGCVGEVAATGIVMVRSVSKITGGLYFVASGATQTGCGIQIGDTANGTGVARCYIRTSVENLACTSAATACLNIANDATQNDVEINANAPAGSVVWSGAHLSGSRFLVHATGQTTQNNAANSLNWDTTGITYQRLPDATGQAYTLTNANALADILNINTNSGTKEIGHINGYRDRWYTDGYVTPSLDILGLTGHIVPRSGVTGSLTPAIVSNAGTTGAAIGAKSSDTAGLVTATTVAAPGTSDLLTVTFKNAFANPPAVGLTPTTLAAGLMSVYCKALASGFTISSAQAPPAGADTAAVGWSYHVLGQDA